MGIHGSGKTTTTQILAQFLRERGYIVKTNEDIWKEAYKFSKTCRLLRTVFSPIVWLFLIYAIIDSIRRIITQRSIEGKHSLRDLLRPLNDIILRKQFISFYKKDTDFFIFDEGSAYVVTDLFWKYQVPRRYISLF